MPDTMTTHSGAEIAAPRGLFARILGVILSPGATYADVSNHPRSAGVFFIVVLVSVAATAGFLATNVGQEALLDQMIRTAESFGRSVSDARYARLQEIVPYAAGFGAVALLVGLPVALLAVSGLVVGVFSGLMGGRARFGQVVAVVAHSGVIVALQQLFVPLSSATNLAAFAPMFDEGSFPARLLGAIDLFRVWWMLSLAIGIGVLYRRRTMPIALGMLAVYVGIALVVALVQTVLSGA